MRTAVETPHWRCLVSGADVAECPVATGGDALYWIDVHAPALHRTSLSDRTTTTWPVPDTIGSFALHDTGAGAIVALRSGVYHLDLGSGAIRREYAAPYDEALFRFNDGRCDEAGRFWVGNLRSGYTDADIGSAAFWRIDPGAGMSEQITGTTVANGIAFSPDARTLYLGDHPNNRILAFDFDVAAGTASNRRTFAEVPVRSGPDGAAVDAAGNYWVAMCYLGRVFCFSPAGRLIRELITPTSFPTMVAFGGPDHRTLFLTTGTRAATGAWPACVGGVYACDIDVTGRPEPRYATVASAVHVDGA